MGDGMDGGMDDAELTGTLDDPQVLRARMSQKFPLSSQLSYKSPFSLY